MIKLIKRFSNPGKQNKNIIACRVWEAVTVQNHHYLPGMGSGYGAKTPSPAGYGKRLRYQTSLPAGYVKRSRYKIIIACQGMASGSGME